MNKTQERKDLFLNILWFVVLVVLIIVDIYVEKHAFYAMIVVWAAAAVAHVAIRFTAETEATGRFPGADDGQ